MEKELKFGLTQQDYDKLQRFLHFGDGPRHQDNIYYDTPNRTLGRKKMALRIRVTDRKESVLTVKVTRKEVAGYAERDEYESVVPLAEIKAQLRRPKGWVASLEQVRAFRQLLKHCPSLDLPRLHMVVRFQTSRQTTRWKGFSLELDACTAYSTRFYELEVETSARAAAEKMLSELKEQANISLRPLKRSKLAKALACQKSAEGK